MAAKRPFQQSHQILFPIPPCSKLARNHFRITTQLSFFYPLKLQVEKLFTSYLFFKLPLLYPKYVNTMGSLIIK